MSKLSIACLLGALLLLSLVCNISQYKRSKTIEYYQNADTIQMRVKTGTYIIHSVRVDETIGFIANKYGVSVQNILSVNPVILDVNEIQVNQIIFIPWN